MAKKSPTLTFRDIVLGADAEVIRQAHQARLKIDELIVERQRAYERIAELETQVEDVMGEPGLYPFPPPPLPVAGFDPKAEAVTRGAPAAKPTAPARPPAVAGGKSPTAPAAGTEPAAGPGAAALPPERKA